MAIVYIRRGTNIKCENTGLSYSHEGQVTFSANNLYTICSLKNISNMWKRHFENEKIFNFERNIIFEAVSYSAALASTLKFFFFPSTCT